MRSLKGNLVNNELASWNPTNVVRYAGTRGRRRNLMPLHDLA